MKWKGNECTVLSITQRNLCGLLQKTSCNELLRLRKGLIASGADVYATDMFRRTALIYAAMKGELKILEVKL